MEEKINRSGGFVPPFLEKHQTEISIFLAVFVIVLSTLRMNPTILPSEGNFEQWLNNVNDMFIGKQDFLFSYGPMYWITGNTSAFYSSRLYWMAIVFWSLLSGVFWAAIVSTAIRNKALLFLAAVFFLFINGVVYGSALFLIPFALVAYFEKGRDQRIELRKRTYILLGALAGLAFYIRFFFGVSALLTFGAYFFSRFVIDRKFDRPALFLASLVAAYVLAGTFIFSDMSSIINYLKINKSLSFGNSVDMVLEVENDRNTFTAIAIAVVLLNIYLIKKNPMLVLPVNAMLLLTFKLGFSRTDHYLPYFVAPASILALSMAFNSDRLGKVLLVPVLGCIYYVQYNPAYPGAPTKDAFAETTDFSHSYEHRLRDLYRSYVLPQNILSTIGDSTIEVYPLNHEYALGNGLNYVHRPSFQGFMTLTPELGEMNRAFFESKDRPQFVLWTAGPGCSVATCNVFESVDSKHGLNEDPITSTAILTNYYAVASASGYKGYPVLLMQANDNVAKIEPKVIGKQAMEFGKWYNVPASEGTIKVVPNFEHTLLGKLQNTLFRGEIVRVKYKLSSGMIREYRLNILNSKAGVLASVIPTDFTFEGEAVEAIMFETKSNDYLRPTFEAEWVSARIPGFKVKEAVFDAVTTPAFTNLDDIDCSGSVDSIAGIPPVASGVEATGAMHTFGWIIASMERGRLFDQVFVTLTDEQGKKIYIKTHMLDRPDLIAAFGNPGFRNAGFEAMIDTKSLKGRNILSLAALEGSTLHQCRISIPVTIH